jgi:uncharacterized protein YecT (DUF1311 family)
MKAPNKSKILFVILLMSVALNLYHFVFSYGYSILPFDFQEAGDLSQSELNIREDNGSIKAQKELDRLEKKILLKYESDTMFIENFRISQSVWIKFREAEMKMMFPDYPGWHGSGEPMCKYNYRAWLTNMRIDNLKRWMVGAEQGDMCSGSIMVKD